MYPSAQTHQQPKNPTERGMMLITFDTRESGNVIDKDALALKDMKAT